MNVLLTSFQRSHNIGHPACSVAVYQPEGYALPKVEWADIRRGKVWTRPRDFIAEPDPLAAYHQSLLDLYRTREDQIRQWIEANGRFWTTMALCCWCPYDRAAQRQLGEHGSFVCHSAVVGEILEELGVRVWYDSDRRLMKVLP